MVYNIVQPNEQHHFLLACESKQIPVLVRRHNRAKRYILKCNPYEQQAVVTIPEGGSVGEAKKFIQSHAKWVEKKFDTYQQSVVFAPGTLVPFQGQQLLLSHSNSRLGVTWLDMQSMPNRLVVSGELNHFGRRVQDYFKTQALIIFRKRVAFYAKQLGVEPGTIRVRDTKTRWGSCSTKGILSFSWRLVFAPPEILDYLVAHEVAHLKEMNHGVSFWSHVASLYPDYKRCRAWLKTYGFQLHRYRCAFS